MTATVTAETITRAQIKALRAEAETAGDYAQVDACNRALSRSPILLVSLLVDGETVTVEQNALELCADAINEAAAR
ncbi:MAG: hypothetical protein KBD62_35620 [Kofleriaceae bacterium]|nr:hypothetical protein [Kofleriaceae bacterium]